MVTLKKLGPLFADFCRLKRREWYFTTGLWLYCKTGDGENVWKDQEQKQIGEK